MFIQENFEWGGSQDFAAHGWATNLVNDAKIECDANTCRFKTPIAAGEANNNGINAEMGYLTRSISPINSGETVYVRFDIEYQSGYVFNNGQMKMFYVRAINSNGDLAWRVEIANYGSGGNTAQLFVDLNIHYDHLNPNVGDGTLTGGQKYTVVCAITPNTVGVTNGKIKVWLNGRLVIDYDNVDMRKVPPAKGPAETPLNDILVGSYYGGPTGAHPYQVLWYDNIIVSDNPADINVEMSTQSVQSNAVQTPVSQNTQIQTRPIWQIRSEDLITLQNNISQVQQTIQQAVEKDSAMIPAMIAAVVTYFMSK